MKIQFSDSNLFLPKTSSFLQYNAKIKLLKLKVLLYFSQFLISETFGRVNRLNSIITPHFTTGKLKLKSLKSLSKLSRTFPINITSSREMLVKYDRQCIKISGQKSLKPFNGQTIQSNKICKK